MRRTDRRAFRTWSGLLAYSVAISLGASLSLSLLAVALVVLSSGG